MLCQVLRRR